MIWNRQNCQVYKNAHEPMEDSEVVLSAVKSLVYTYASKYYCEYVSSAIVKHVMHNIDVYFSLNAWIKMIKSNNPKNMGSPGSDKNPT